jgi:GNAT superfamily N-acetyltransferase
MLVAVIDVREEAYDGEVGIALVAALNDDIETRYAGDPDSDFDPPAPPGARPAPRSAPPNDPLWHVTADDVTRPRGAFVVARIDGEPVGCGALRPLPGGEQGIGEIKRMYTAPSARRRGVARLVLWALVDAARELGYSRLVLETGTRQPEAMALYPAEGWYPVVVYGEYRGSHLSRCFGLDLSMTARDDR